MAWKFWEPRGDWTEPRSFVGELDGRIVAHVGIWPVTYRHGGAEIRGVHMLDWVASADSRGAGLMLVQKLMSTFDFVWGIGGSDITRKLLPSLGFAEVAQVWTAARPVRIVRQMLTHQSRNWKLAPRFLRNLAWAYTPLKAVGPRWTVTPMPPAGIPRDLIPTSPAESRFSPRGPEFFEYLARCPVLRYQLYGLSDGQGLQGFFALGVVRGQARVGGVWLRHPSVEHWTAAFTQAVRTAAATAGACEIAVSGSVGPSSEAVVQAGFRLTGRVPGVLYSKKGNVTLPADFQFQMVDDDEAYMDLGQNYLT